VGVRHTESSLIVWTGESVQKPSQGKKTEPVIPLFKADEFYNAGDQGCASGPMDEISAKMQSLQAGQTLEIHATDPTVSIDIGAWCRMTGHQLLKQQGSHYLIQHK
jgi:tRNA 2-thiouridine synthesizing protein A